ncbi:aminotransferase class I/II-fold pyridoxal phosphate-dependent enzyme [Aquihabitans sp. G128]|uniref:aminotransferase-like domain-containing protein n=1 Tax=Aquihabitans sp. G128 TaxID=2849779 RepID=UPI001C22B409|nr:aminotransferase class I/II-fold pyridoxal phosphate-dependent enzyme [Aquihabitans sp. G128]QXC61208.1 aminotransferase class I/II-fold pyridoxal phosphate-dependent enzyme [Aquihabitans sp. G128]
MLDDMVAAIDNRSAQGIAAAIGRMVSAGELPVGDRLPTVRELSKALGVSPTTVSEAWKTLAAVGAIDPRGRLGTFVRQPPGPGGTHRYRRITDGPGRFDLDLSTGFPDVGLLPDLRPIVADVSRQSLTSSYLDRPVLPELWDHLHASWPFPPEELTVVDGAMDAIDRVARELVHLGDRVVVENPTFPPVLDLFEQLGAEVIGVNLDAEGLVLAELASALEYEPRLVFVQPRAHNPTGTTWSAKRARAVSRLVAPTAAVVVEDDHSGDIASGEPVSVGTWLPDRTVHIRSYSKSHGPDLRLAAVGGAGSVIDRVTDRRLLGPGWSSRILQSVLLALLTDPTATWAVEAARHAYASRRREFTRALAERGVATTGTDGINQWVEVADERSALVGLAARGIGVAPGEPFMVRPAGDHLRITIGLLDGPISAIEHLAEQVADVAGGPGARVGRRPS